MLIGSTLLLDDAFKPATPWTDGVINETLQQFAQLGDISQGSVETHLRCGGIFSFVVIAIFLLILKVKAYKNCAIFGATLYICTRS